MVDLSIANCKRLPEGTGKVLDRWSFALRKPRFVRTCRAIDHQVYHNEIATKWTWKKRYPRYPRYPHPNVTYKYCIHTSTKAREIPENPIIIIHRSHSIPDFCWCLHHKKTKLAPSFASGPCGSPDMTRPSCFSSCRSPCTWRKNWESPHWIHPKIRTDGRVHSHGGTPLSLDGL